MKTRIKLVETRILLSILEQKICIEKSYRDTIKMQTCFFFPTNFSFWTP